MAMQGNAGEGTIATTAISQCNDSKDPSATTLLAPLQQWCQCQHNDCKDTSMTRATMPEKLWQQL
jgi:hypothetical protein